MVVAQNVPSFSRRNANRNPKIYLPDNGSTIIFVSPMEIQLESAVNLYPHTAYAYVGTFAQFCHRTHANFEGWENPGVEKYPQNAQPGHGSDEVILRRMFLKSKNK